MAIRITKKMLEARVEHLNKKLGRPLEPYTKDPETGNIKGNEGHIRIDHNSFYGGYRLTVMHESTGESNFSSGARMSARELLIFLDGVFNGIDLASKE